MYLNHLALSWAKINPDIYSFLQYKNENRIVGYINAIPVVDDLFEKVKAGKIQDNEVRPEHIVSFTPNTDLKIYLMSIALAPEARSANDGDFQKAFEKLIRGFLHKLDFYVTEKKIKAKEFVSIAWTEEGKRLCTIMGMKKIGKDSLNHDIYYLRVDPFSTKDKKIFYGARRLFRKYIDSETP